ncbi:MAG: efflux RND transporter periplasmic adaptor subunit [Saprospiraceae bacterium]|nr:efflux RND transporter periplasmic adaptor subunit [Saprospiraceae bacterium]
MHLKVNLLYWFLIPLVLAGLWWLFRDMSNHKYEFLGFAENQEAEINSDQDLVIQEIRVRTGDMVKKGDTLVIGKRYFWDEEINQADLKLQELRLKGIQQKSEIKRNIAELEQEMNQKLASLRSRINIAESEASFYQSLVQGTDPGFQKNTDKNNYILENLVNEYNAVKDAYLQMINTQKLRLSEKSPDEAVSEQVNQRKASYAMHKSELAILAPQNGIVGTIQVREGEHVKAFTDILSLYDAAPPTVTGYINEKFTANVNVGDSVILNSLYHPQKTVKGIILNKGHRMIEIPEKFRRIPEVKTYGVEIFVKIDQTNHFLQREVVIIKTMHK